MIPSRRVASPAAYLTSCPPRAGGVATSAFAFSNSEWPRSAEKKKLPPGEFFSLTENLRAAKNKPLERIPTQLYDRVLNGMVTQRCDLKPLRPGYDDPSSLLQAPVNSIASCL